MKVYHILNTQACFCVILLLFINNVYSQAVCGDGIVSPGELCDTLINKCCGPDCTSILGSGTVCRESQGPCDSPEECDGMSFDCPLNQYLGIETLCRPSMGACDAPEYCDNTGPSCPEDLALPSTIICRSVDTVLYPCELNTYCPGDAAMNLAEAKICPSTEYRDGTFVCRQAINDCDVSETCDPNAVDPGLCPPNMFELSTTPCELDNLVCSVESCSGVSANCNTDTPCPPCTTDLDCPVVDANCTVGVCSAGVCTTNALPASGFCFIDGKCYADGEPNPYNSCEFCDVASDLVNWSNRIMGFACDTGNPQGACSDQDTCDGSGTCVDRYLGAMSVCRPTAGICDVEETCPGNSDECPQDTFLPLGTTCRAVIPGDFCDVPESCTGFSPLCPEDKFKEAGVLCRSSQGICDVPETCTGTSKQCPMDIFRENDFLCREPTGPCDAPEHCLGNNVMLVEQPWLCPVDLLRNTSYICREMVAGCDAPEYCDELTDQCPPNVLFVNGTVCREAEGDCDKEEICNGIDIECPPDEVRGEETICRASLGSCDPEERCPGDLIKDCPEDVIYPDTFVCRVPQGPCEEEVTCPGPTSMQYWVCPPREFKPSTEICRPQNGICDIPENCDGFTALCPIDSVAPLTTLCRPPVASCDRPDFCDGVSKNCPADAVEPNTFTCHTARGSCETSVNCDGITVNCPDFNYLSSTTICRGSQGNCDPSETCDPLSATPWLCPEDILFDNSTLCRGQTGPCGTPTFCDNNNAVCPPEQYLDSTVLCRPSSNQCDEPEFCNEMQSSCPTDTFKPLNFPCNIDALNCTIDECNGFGQCQLIEDNCECMIASDCPVNVTCIVPSCLNGFCSESIAQDTCFIDGVCYNAGERNPSNQCQDCQPNVDPTAWQFALVGTSCQTMTAEGICSGQDTCDGMGVCVDNYLDTTNVCRTAVGLCDLEETCPGDSDFCPPDIVKGIGVLCRNATDLCDEPEFCTSNSPFCPEDLVSPANKTCAVARGVCEQDAKCRGSNPGLPLQQAKECPDRLLFSSEAVCRPSVAVCDAPEFCDPLSQEPWLCPVDEPEPSTTICREAQDSCDAPDFCDGAMFICPATDNKRPAGYVCRSASDTCEQVATCDGVNDICPPNQFEPSTTVCYVAQGSCDMDVHCPGNSTSCPSIGPNPKMNGVQCFTRRGECEGDGFCNGVDVDCQREGFFSDTTVCRASTDECDPEETCPGDYWKCPLDQVRPDGYPCPNSIFCDGDEVCISGICQPSMTPRDCDDDNVCTMHTCNEETERCEYTLVPGAGLPCYTGPTGTVNVGQCREGITVCNATTGIITCANEILPDATERCGDRIDNNCNGVVDEGCAGITCLDDGDCEPFKPSPCHQATCTTFNYDNDTICTYSILPGFCFVAGSCYIEGEVSPYNICRDCQPEEHPYVFSANDTVNPSDNNVCNGVEQCYYGELITNPRPLDCPSYVGQCKLSLCDPVLGCITPNLPDGTNCTLLHDERCSAIPSCQQGQCICPGMLLPDEKNSDSILTVVLVVSICFVALVIVGITAIICTRMWKWDNLFDESRLQQTSNKTERNDNVFVTNRYTPILSRSQKLD